MSDSTTDMTGTAGGNTTTLAPEAPPPGQAPEQAPQLAKAPDEDRERGQQIILEEFGSQEEFERALEATIKEFDDGDIVEGVIVKVDPEEVLLDIGYKSEGVIPSRELSIKHDVNPFEIVAIGDVVEALVLQKEDKDGRLILSKKRAQYERAWGKIEEIHNNDSTVTGTVIEVVKGGLILDIGLRGFLPASLVEMRRVRDLHPYVGKELECKVIELDKNRNNVVLSRRKFLEETQSEFRKEFLETLQKGEIRKGVVSSIVNFGAFVDLGGVDGLVHVSELSWKHIDHPGEVVEVGQEVEVEVLDVDLERERVSLSLKATQEDPWRQFARQHYVGEFIEGKVTKLVPFGAFVKVEEGIEGLVHISELAEAHVEVPEQVVKVGNDITVKVIDIDDVRRRISLSLKQAVKAGYGEAPEIVEEPAYTGGSSSGGGGGGDSTGGGGQADPTESAMGAALAAALQQRETASGEPEPAGGLSLEAVVADLQVQSDEVTPDEVIPDEVSPAEASPDEASPDEVTPDEATPDEASLAEVTPDEASPDEVTPAEVTPDEATPDEVTPDDVTPDEASPDDVTPDEVAPAEIAPDEVAPETSSSEEGNEGENAHENDNEPS